jgi:HEAT repeat protein
VSVRPKPMGRSLEVVWHAELVSAWFLRRKVSALERRRDLVGLAKLLRNQPATGSAAAALRRVGGRVALSALIDAHLDKDFPGDRAALAKVLSLAIVPSLALLVRPKYLARDAAAQARRLVLAGDLHTASALLWAIGDGAQAADASGMRWGVASYAATAANRATAALQRMQLRNRGSIADRLEYNIASEREELISELARLEALLATLPEELETANLSLLVEDAEARSFVDQLVRLVGSGETAIRRSAIEQLVRLGDPAAIPALRGCLHEPDPQVRYAAIAALTVLDGLTSIDDLHGALQGPHWVIRLAAVAALRRLNGSAAIDALRARLDDDHYEVRMAALAIAAPIDGRVLRQGVVDANEEVRAQAVLVAGDLDDPQWGSTIAPLLTDSYRLARREAGKALSRWAWAGDPISVAIAATKWDAVFEAGIEAAELLMRAFGDVYVEHDSDKEPALRTLERLVEVHGKAIPEHVLRAGADFEDFDGELQGHTDQDFPIYSRVDASELRRLCEAALKGRR